jgi:hypothetical protein
MYDLYDPHHRQEPHSDPWGPYSDTRWATQDERSRAEATLEVSPDGRNLSKEQKAKLLTDERIRGKAGFAATRIRAHYGNALDVPQMTAEERAAKLDLSNDDGRIAALSRMRQNGEPMSKDGAFRCGASSLVGGMVYGGGKQGVQMLLAAMVADRSKLKRPDGGKDEQPWMDDELKKLMGKLKDEDGKLTMGDLDLIQSKTYEFFKDQKPGKPGQEKGEGLSGKDLQKFIAGHKDIKKLFADKDMALNGIDLTGDGRSEHMVLGIGHERLDGGRAQMIYDPQARQNKENWGDWMSQEDREKIYLEERKKMQAEFDRVNARAGKDKRWEKDLDKLRAQLDERVHNRQYAYKHGSQIVTDVNELRDYRKATDYEANANKVIDHDAQTKPFDGMY